MQRIFEAKRNGDKVFTRCYDVDEYGREIRIPMEWRESPVSKSNTRDSSIILAAELQGFKAFEWTPNHLIAYMYKNI